MLAHSSARPSDGQVPCTQPAPWMCCELRAAGGGRRLRPGPMAGRGGPALCQSVFHGLTSVRHGANPLCSELTPTQRPHFPSVLSAPQPLGRRSGCLPLLVGNRWRCYHCVPFCGSLHPKLLSPDRGGGCGGGTNSMHRKRSIGRHPWDLGRNNLQRASNPKRMFDLPGTQCFVLLKLIKTLYPVL